MDQKPFGLDRRVFWNSDRFAGSPEPPLPYTVEPVFTNLQWRAPIFIAPEPESNFLQVVHSGGEKERPSRIFRLPDDPHTSQRETFLELSNRLVYSVAFHPGFRTNGNLYVFTHGVSGEFARTNRVSRFRVAPDSSPRCDPASERVILEWRSEGHDGGGLVFGHDGMLYVSTGDGTSDSDGWVTGQDLSEWLGGVLRIDVNRKEGTRPYAVPPDNPFVGLTNALPENWAYGLRNPWRMDIDRKTGAIWVGNNGQDLWETAHLLRRGENYGWSVYEGSHPFYLNRRLGPTPAVAPTLEHSHANFRSLTGGTVYYGGSLPQLNGAYVYGDYSSGEIWGALHDGTRLKWHRQLAQTQLQISAFAASHTGALLIADHGGGLYQLVRAPARDGTPRFPTRLSETGLFVSTREHQVGPAMIPYSVNAPGWVDGAFAERFMALPQNSRLGALSNGAVLVQTLSLERRAGDATSRQRIETRLLTRQQGQWFGYSYRWNEKQTDAALVSAQGDERQWVTQDAHVPGGVRRQTWRFPSRAECMTCHSRAAGFVLGVTEPQLNRVHDYGGSEDNQLRTLKHVGVFTGSMPRQPAPVLVDPYDASQPLDQRARSYLHVNCSVCHVDAGGGNAKMELGFTTVPGRMHLVGERPQHDTFGIDNAMLVFPGDPGRSVLWQRLCRRGRGQMPPLVSAVVDERAVALFREWISGMTHPQPFVREWRMEDLLPALPRLGAGRSLESGKAAFLQTGCNQCHQFAGEGGSVGPRLDGIGRRSTPRDLLESLVLPSKVITEGYAATEIETKSGDSVSGRVEREDGRAIVLRPPGANDATMTIRKSDIRRRTVSTLSNMPSGMLNTLTEEQVLDLLAYLSH